eukprot:5268163-Lingulodinium_polyedra.AAC.1
MFRTAHLPVPEVGVEGDRQVGSAEHQRLEGERGQRGHGVQGAPRAGGPDDGPGPRANPEGGVR